MLSTLKRAALAMGVIGACITPAVLASPAAAQPTRPAAFKVVTVRSPAIAQRPGASKYVFRTNVIWSRSYGGVNFGWTNDHLWVMASYATLMSADVGAAAGIGCGMIVGGWAIPVCAQAVKVTVGVLISGWPRLTNHGVWVSYYPRSIWNGYTTGGRY